MQRFTHVQVTGSIAGLCVAALGLAGTSGCFSSSSTPDDKADAQFSMEAATFEASPTNDGGAGFDGNATPEGGADTGSTVPSDSGAGCTGDGGPGSFTCVANMGTARVAAGIASLPGGKALVAGGWNATSLTLTSAEVFDSASGTFSPTGSMVSAHLWGEWGTGLPVLPGGNVLAAGGLDGTGALVGVAEIYDVTSGTFSATGSLKTPVISMFPVVLADSSVILLGGWSSTTGAPPTPGWMFYGDGTNEVQRYSPTAGTFADLPPLAENRLVGCNVVLSNGNLLAIGGSQGPSTNESNIEQYVPTAGTAGQWSTLGTLTNVQACLQAFTLPSGKVLMLGTSTTENADLLDPVALTTTATTGFPATWVPYYVQLANGDVLAYGGTLNNVITANAMAYRTASNTWESVGPMGAPRGGAMTATLLTTGDVLIVGGADTADPVLATAELYHP